MPEEEKRSVLEQLELEFEKEHKKRKKNFRVPVIGFLLAICLFAAAGAAGKSILSAKLSQSTDIEVPQFLSRQEKKEWKTKETDENEIYVYVNTRLTVGEENEIQLRLANPPYCLYPIKISIKDKNNGDVYYTSGVLKPGDSLEKVNLEKAPDKAGTHEAVIHYTFYAEGSQDTVVGEHMVSAELIVK